MDPALQTVSAALSQPEAWLAGTYDVAVIGAGHAGCEAALAAARLGCRTILFAMNLDAVANMPCNPNIGGTAKGQLVREIDALGGEMGRLADRTMIQFRMLNRSRGPAVQSPRAQIDRRRYQMGMKAILERQPNLDLRQAEIVSLLLADPEAKASAPAAGSPAPVPAPATTQNAVAADDGTGAPADAGTAGRPLIGGVLTRSRAVFAARAVVVATGTYLESRIIIGACQYPGGPDSLFPSHGLSASIRAAGLPMQRFKTGTPARISRGSVNHAAMERQDGDRPVVPFSFEHEPGDLGQLAEQEPCWLTYTTPQTRAIILGSLDRSPLYSGAIEGIGPRYCPSIEDKFVKFPDKERHQIFIEPTGRDTEELYVQGMSSSMPEEVQLAMLRSVAGLENVRVMRSAYAIEYDCLDPTGLDRTLAARSAGGLWFAGQVNGTSGYEEAAAQGLVAGINAARSVHGEAPVVIDRATAYIGVLIDDLVTKGTREPYRMMTARAEYRLLLRQDNADSRLTPLGHAIGLIPDGRHARFLEKDRQIHAETARCRSVTVRPTAAVNAMLTSLGTAALANPATLAELLRRPELDYASLAPLDPERPDLPPAVRESVEITLKYEGYIRLEEERIRRFQQLEDRPLPAGIDYGAISGLRLEARQKLSRLCPASIGQAARISGVSPADISVLLVWLEALRRGGQSRTPAGAGESKAPAGAGESKTPAGTRESKAPAGDGESHG